MGLVASNPGESLSPRRVLSPRKNEPSAPLLLSSLSSVDLQMEQASDMKKLRQRSRSLNQISPTHEDEPYQKILLLGTGDGGKSTWLKQCRALYQIYSSHELRAAREQVSSNLLEFMGQLINACENTELSILNEAAAIEIQKTLQQSQIFVSVSDHITPVLVDHMKSLWREKSCQIAFEGRKEFQINENGKYWMDNIDRITHPDYVPTMDDLLRTRMKTVGIIETEKVLEISENLINTENNRISLVDVGGQRTERKKWGHCYANASAILFFVPLSEYDENLYEDEKTNRLLESLRLFSKIVNEEERLSNVSHIFIIFTKLDLFIEQIQACKSAVNNKESKLLSTFEEGLVYEENARLHLQIPSDQKTLEQFADRCAQTIAQRFVREVRNDKKRQDISRRCFLADGLKSDHVKFVMTEVLKDVCLSIQRNDSETEEILIPE